MTPHEQLHADLLAERFGPPVRSRCSHTPPSDTISDDALSVLVRELDEARPHLRIAPSLGACSYAACDRSATVPLDSYLFCSQHARAHRSDVAS